MGYQEFLGRRGEKHNAYCSVCGICYLSGLYSIVVAVALPQWRLRPAVSCAKGIQGYAGGYGSYFGLLWLSATPIQVFEGYYHILGFRGYCGVAGPARDIIQGGYIEIHTL